MLTWNLTGWNAHRARKPPAMAVFSCSLSFRNWRHTTTPLLEMRDGGFLLLTPALALLSRVSNGRGRFQYNTTSPLLEMRDKGLYLPTPALRLAFRAVQGVFSTTPPLPRSKCETQGCSCQCLPSLSTFERRRVFSCPFHPPSLETQDGGLVSTSISFFEWQRTYITLFKSFVFENSII